VALIGTRKNAENKITSFIVLFLEVTYGVNVSLDKIFEKQISSITTIFLLFYLEIK